MGPYTEESDVVDDLRGDIGVLGFWSPRRICILGVHAVDTYASSYEGKYPD